MQRLNYAMTAKIRIYDLGRKKANVDEFPFCAQYVLLVLEISADVFGPAWFPMNTNKSHPKHLKPLVFAPTNTSQRPLAKIPSI